MHFWKRDGGADSGMWRRDRHSRPFAERSMRVSTTHPRWRRYTVNKTGNQSAVGLSTQSSRRMVVVWIRNPECWYSAAQRRWVRIFQWMVDYIDTTRKRVLRGG